MQAVSLRFHWGGAVDGANVVDFDANGIPFTPGHDFQGPILSLLCATGRNKLSILLDA